MRPGRGMMNFEFTFDLFISAAILTMHRDQICQSTDAASVYGCLNRSVCVAASTGQRVWLPQRASVCGCLNGLACVAASTG